MCLEKLIEGLPDWEEGYKLMFIEEDCIYGEIYNGYKKRSLNKWLDEKSFRICQDKTEIIVSSFVKYLIGWHVFKSLEGCQKWLSDLIYTCKPKEMDSTEFKIQTLNKFKIYKVKCRKPLAHGYQNSDIVGVFKEVKFIEEVKDEE